MRVGATGLALVVLGFTIAAHQDTVRDRLDLVRQVVAASILGFEAARDPGAAIKALGRFGPLADLAAAREQLAFDLSFLFSSAYERRRVGHGPPEDWEAMLEALKKYRGLETNLSGTAFYTNAFLP